VLLHPTGHHAHVGRLSHHQHRAGAQRGHHCRGGDRWMGGSARVWL
jgi:hypothetical protein